mmetsp:Transcript_4275/g.10295  ORF Transcript_4275/g.10295 Transcript_4275/m.10295 type:complete len:200 (+) Transcript_4275:1304-1903(+)
MLSWRASRSPRSIPRACKPRKRARRRTTPPGPSSSSSQSRTPAARSRWCTHSRTSPPPRAMPPPQTRGCHSSCLRTRGRTRCSARVRWRRTMASRLRTTPWPARVRQTQRTSRAAPARASTRCCTLSCMSAGLTGTCTSWTGSRLALSGRATPPSRRSRCWRRRSTRSRRCSRQTPRSCASTSWPSARPNNGRAYGRDR